MESINYHDTEKKIDGIIPISNIKKEPSDAEINDKCIDSIPNIPFIEIQSDIIDRKRSIKGSKVHSPLGTSLKSKTSSESFNSKEMLPLVIIKQEDSEKNSVKSQLKCRRKNDLCHTQDAIEKEHNTLDNSSNSAGPSDLHSGLTVLDLGEERVKLEIPDHLLLIKDQDKPSHTSDLDRAKVIAYNKLGWEIWKIAEDIGRSAKTVRRIIKQYHKCGDFKKAKKRKFHSATTPEQDDAIRTAVANNPNMTARDIQSEFDIPASTQTIRRRLHEGNIWRRCLVKKEKE